MIRVLLLCAAVCTALPAQQPQRVLSTVVSADTGGRFWRRGPDTLWVWNQTWARQDSAPALPDCVYSGRAQRMLARDSMHVTITNHVWTWERTLKPGDEFPVNWTAPLVTGFFTLLDVSAPSSPCGVNAATIWFHWRYNPIPLAAFLPPWGRT